MSSTSIALMVVAEWASQELGEGAEDGWYNKKGFREDLYKCEQIEFIRLRARLPYPLTDFKDGQNYNRKKELQGRIDCVGFEGLKALARWDEGHHEEHYWQVEHRVSCSVLKKIIAKKRFTLTECKALICIWNTANTNLFAVGSMTNKALANFTSMAVDGKLDFDDPEVATYHLSEEDGWTTDMKSLSPGGKHARFAKAMIEYLVEGYPLVIEAVKESEHLSDESRQ